MGTSSVSSSPTMKPQQLLQLFQQGEIHPTSGQISRLWGCHTPTKKLQGGFQVKPAPGLGQERGDRSLRLFQSPSSHCIPSKAEPGGQRGDAALAPRGRAGIDLNLLTWNCTQDHWGAPESSTGQTHLWDLWVLWDLGRTQPAAKQGGKKQFCF